MKKIDGISALNRILDCNIIEDIGQFTDADRKFLNKAAKMGAISKGKGGEFPIIKTVYAPNGFDFEAHRAAVLNKVRIMSGMEYITHRFDYSQFITK